MKLNIELNTDNDKDMAIIDLFQTLAKGIAESMVEAVNQPLPDPLPQPTSDDPIPAPVPPAPVPPAPATADPAPSAPPPPPVTTKPEPLYDPTAIPEDAPGAEVIQLPVAKGPLDEVGCPWDERIHAGTKTKTESGKWKRRRGIDNDFFRTIMHEITDPTYTPTADAGPEGPVADAGPDTPPDAATAGFGEQGNSGAVAWGEIVQKVMSAKVQELITQEQVEQVVTKLGVEGGFNAMASRPELYPQFIIELSL